ncbi:hypothetical protein FH972_010453 [Carpinus fangiana]|uniref:Uncharacterized protein n=1 Tax=Carpinus fangiana TaxID=176857 RepID=A0A660KQD0_9ROSI|nr:hypothetical protein FH972_010453 [Carpinus fangiana]
MIRSPPSMTVVLLQRGFAQMTLTDYLQLSLNSFYPPPAMLSLSIAPVSHSDDTHSTAPALSLNSFCPPPATLSLPRSCLSLTPATLNSL